MMKVDWDISELTNFAAKLSNTSLLDKNLKNATKRLAKALLRWMKEFTPVDGYTLISGWEGNNFAVTRKGDVFEVLIVNKTPYALAVNDGHRVRNRKGGEYYQVKRRIQVRKAHQWQADTSDWYVYGHFFVERGILRLSNTTEIENIIMQEIRKWWDSL